MVDQRGNKRTSQTGFVEPEPFGTQGRLFDFDIDGSEFGVDGTRLKSRHIEFLKSLVTRIGTATNQNLVIRIGGTADSLNQGGFSNQALSEKRAVAVRTFLQGAIPRGVNVDFKMGGFKGGLGDSDAKAASGENARNDFFRAVDVALIAPDDPEPEPPNIPKQNPTPNRTPGKGEFPKPEFALTCVREFEMPRSQAFSIRLEQTAILGIAQILFSIRDDANRLEAQYRLSGVDFGVSDVGQTSEPTQLRSFRTAFETRVTEFKSASLTILRGPPRMSLTYLSADGKTQSVDVEIDVGDISRTPRTIRGFLTMESTCGQGVRGAQKFAQPGGNVVR